jgi:hypothetical protein
MAQDVWSEAALGVTASIGHDKEKENQITTEQRKLNNN